MITTEEKEKLKPILGGNYTQEVIKGLIENGCRSYSANYIKSVLNSKAENSDIEMVIWKVASVKKQRLNKINEYKNQTLK